MNITYLLFQNIFITYVIAINAYFNDNLLFLYVPLSLMRAVVSIMYMSL